MTRGALIRCRVAACPVGGDAIARGGRAWDFYLINDGDAPLDSAVLKQVIYTWGDAGGPARMPTCVSLASLSAPTPYSGEVTLLFEFPKLYRQEKLPLVEGLGLPGWQEIAEG